MLDAAPTPILDRGLARDFNHATQVKAFGHNVALFTATILAIVGVGVGLPTYASAIREQDLQSAEHVSPPQSLVVAPAAIAATPIERDTYSVYTPPPVMYPLTTGTGITSGFGLRGGRMHEGADIFPGMGTPIHAMAAGVVVAVNRPGWSAMGQHVVLQHVIDGQVVTSTYAHMLVGSITVGQGDYVQVGQVLGKVGATGNAQGAHLHFEIRPGGGAPVNPYPWIAAKL